MLKREIKYEDFNGETQTEVFYFNISKTELLEMSVDGFVEMMQKIIDDKDGKNIMKYSQEVILLSYGVKSEDGKKFEKSAELKEAFAQTAAYDALFTELVTDAGAAAEFIMGVMPKDLSSKIDTNDIASIVAGAEVPIGPTSAAPVPATTAPPAPPTV